MGATYHYPQKKSTASPFVATFPATNLLVNTKILDAVTLGGLEFMYRFISDVKNCVPSCIFYYTVFFQCAIFSISFLDLLRWFVTKSDNSFDVYLLVSCEIL